MYLFTILFWYSHTYAGLFIQTTNNVIHITDEEYTTLMKNMKQEASTQN